MKFLIESGQSGLLISKEGKSIELELNGQKIALQGNDLIDFDNLVGNLSRGIAQEIDTETPLIKKIHRLWRSTN